MRNIPEYHIVVEYRKQRRNPWSILVVTVVAVALSVLWTKGCASCVARYTPTNQQSQWR